ncbi:MAG: histidine phosphatase family protein [Acutalibacter sp.]|jgi:broad specificity phosphatase PhoE
MKKLFTIQHTQSVHHINGMVGSWAEWELTDLGKCQARAIAQNLAPQLTGGVKLYCSPQLRARQTVAPLAELLSVPVEYREELREQNLGEACGKPVQWLRDHSAPQRTVDDRILPGAESIRDVWERLLPFSRELLDRPEEMVVCVSHGITLTIWNSLWLGMEPEDLEHCVLRGRAGGVSCFSQGEDGQCRIHFLADLSYCGGQNLIN